MSRRLLVEAGPVETRLALTEDGIATEFHVRPAGERGVLGEIRLGRITDSAPDMGAFFVDIGHPTPAFLKKKDAGEAREGAIVTVEVIREPLSVKAARVSARSPAALAAAPLAAGRTAPALLRPAPPFAALLARARGVTTLLVAGGEAAASLRAHLPGLPIEIAAGCPDLFAREGIADDFAEALRPALPLGPTGRLSIDETEALCAIDIDGGGLGPRAANETAAPLAARAIRRRNLSGQILIDFIGDAGAIAAGRAALARALAADPLKPDLAKGDLGGLVLVTRRREGESLLRSLTVPCPVSTGRWACAGHLAARLLREAESLARHQPGRPLLARAPADALAVLEAVAETWRGLSLTLEASAFPSREVAVMVRS
ncbi:MAG: ribonuclease E/G [Zavarzinia sp.]|nr:ribonuclease E/G [Zavarzinia sp.]